MVVMLFTLCVTCKMLKYMQESDIVKSKNKIVRAVMVFSLAFVPGVLAASICAKTLVTVYESFTSEPKEIVEEIDEEDSKDIEIKRSEEDAA